MSGTNHIAFTRGQTFSVTRKALDENGRPRNLTGAKIYLACRADMKIAPTFKLCSEDPAPDGTWRIGIVISDQSQHPGQYVYTFAPVDTSALVALGHDDPWLYDVRMKMADNTIVQDVETSNLDLYPQVTDVP